MSDVTAGVGIVAASSAAGAAIGTLIPIPGVGTVAGFLVGAGVGYVYESHLKNDWHKGVDEAGKWLTTNAPKVADKSGQFIQDISHGANDFLNQLDNYFKYFRVPDLGSN